MKTINRLILLTLVTFSTGAMAVEEWVEKEGVVREIDLASRTAIISGYRYYFGSSSGYQKPQMELIYYSTAVFEMLEVDMKVQFSYTSDKPWMRILRLRQLPHDAWDDNQFPDAIP